ncbi:MAG: hypothetical protein B7X28_07605, partial [Halothiobacillus sp. 13-55-253]
RHFAATLRSESITVHYPQIGSHPHGALADALAVAIVVHQPQQVVWVSAGAERLNHALKATCDRHKVPWKIYPDRHFIATENQFSDWAKGRKSLRLEYWYRQLRQQTGLLMEDDQPIGGAWNFDAQNRAAFDARGPGLLPAPMGFPTDAITQQVIETVAHYFPGHPGALDGFDWPVTPEQAEAALEDFITHRLQQTLSRAQPQAHRSGYRVSCRRSGIPSGTSAISRGGGIYPADIGLAGVCSRALCSLWR